MRQGREELVEAPGDFSKALPPTDRGMGHPLHKLLKQLWPPMKSVTFQTEGKM